MMRNESGVVGATPPFKKDKTQVCLLPRRQRRALPPPVMHCQDYSTTNAAAAAQDRDGTRQ